MSAVDPGSPATGIVRKLIALPWWESVLVKTPVGIRLVTGEGRLARIGGANLSRLAREPRVHVLPRARRLFVRGARSDRVFEIVARREGDGSCPE